MLLDHFQEKQSHKSRLFLKFHFNDEGQKSMWAQDCDLYNISKCNLFESFLK